jgi:hypothetical protein
VAKTEVGEPFRRCSGTAIAVDFGRPVERLWKADASWSDGSTAHVRSVDGVRRVRVRVPIRRGTGAVRFEARYWASIQTD